MVFKGKISIYKERTRYLIKVVTAIRNDGDVVYALICSTACNKDKDKSFSRIKALHLDKGQQKVEFTFNEAGFFHPKDRWECWSKIRFLEKPE